MADYNFKGFLDYIKLLDPIEQQSVDENKEEVRSTQDVVLTHEPTLARIINLANYRN